MGIGKASSGNDAITLNNNGALVNDQNVVSEERACYFSTVCLVSTVCLSLRMTSHCTLV